MASIHTTRSTPPDCHSDSANATASWVLPDDLNQSWASGTAARPGSRTAGRSGTSATAAPAGSAAARSGAVSSRAVKRSASAGTMPDRTSQDGLPDAAPAKAGGGTALLVPRWPGTAAWTPADRVAKDISFLRVGPGAVVFADVAKPGPPNGSDCTPLGPLACQASSRMSKSASGAWAVPWSAAAGCGCAAARGRFTGPGKGPAPEWSWSGSASGRRRGRSRA